MIKLKKMAVSLSKNEYFQCLLVSLGLFIGIRFSIFKQFFDKASISQNFCFFLCTYITYSYACFFHPDNAFRDTGGLVIFTFLSYKGPNVVDNIFKNIYPEISSEPILYPLVVCLSLFGLFLLLTPKNKIQS